MINRSRFWLAVLAVAFLSVPVMAVGFSDAYAWWRLADTSDSNPGVSGDQALITPPSPQSETISGAGSNNFFHSGGAMQTTFTFSGGSTTFVRFRYNRDGNPINGVSPITTASGGSLLNKNTPGNGNTLRLRSCEDCFEARQFGSGRNGLASDPAVPGSNWPAAYTNDDTFPVPGAWFDLVYRDDPDNNRYGIIASESAGPFVNVLDSTAPSGRASTSSGVCSQSPTHSISARATTTSSRRPCSRAC